MTVAHLIWTAFGFGMTGFLLGMWRGRQDLGADLEPSIEELHDLVSAIPTRCTCGARLTATCSDRACPTHATNEEEK